MGKWHDEALRMKPYFMKGAQSLSDDEALEVKGIYDEWEVGVFVKVHEKRRYGDRLYRCVAEHTTLPEWTPDVALSLWVVVDETHAGTLEDPIPAAVGMVYYKDLIYSENGKLYRCIRQDSENGTTLYYLPSSLLGHYFEEVTV